MPLFRLNQCSMDLKIEPLVGALAPADRQMAWRIYLALVTRAALREKHVPERELLDLIRALEAMLEQWPAAQIETPRPGHLGFLVVTMIETILLPCVKYGNGASEGWTAVRDFCQSFAREVAQAYGFPDAGASVPKDLIAAWQTTT